MKVIHVLRKPLSEKTVAANTIKHGTGGLNIDASRIGVEERTYKGSGVSQMRYTDGRAALTDGRGRDMGFTVSGRGPANGILQHLDGCRCDGVKRVKGNPPTKKSVRDDLNKGHDDIYGDYGSRSLVGHADKDGKETVANWVCVEGCPVARLDEQSGVSQSSRPNRVSGQFTQPGPKGLIYGFGFGIGWVSPTYNDTGGASRFYKQVGGKSDG